MFADYSTLILGCKESDILSGIKLLEDDLSAFCNWLQVNYIELNKDKTDFMIVGKTMQIEQRTDVNVTLNGTVIKKVHEMKMLWFIIDDK